MAGGCDYLQSSASWIAFHLQSDMSEADLYQCLGSAAQLAWLFLSVSLQARQHATDLIIIWHASFIAAASAGELTSTSNVVSPAWFLPPPAVKRH